MGAEGGARNSDEKQAVQINARAFETSNDPTETKLANFPKYVRRQDLTKLFVRYELFKQILPVKGSIVECGVFRGAGIMTWARLSALLEPNNILRRIYGFDTFEGFPNVRSEDATDFDAAQVGELSADPRTELVSLLEAYDLNRFLGHVPKVELVAGDATETIPDFVTSHQHLVVSLLYLDFDLYEPTLVALKHFLPRMPKGALLVFDELDNPAWPGETLAAIEDGLLRSIELRRLEFDPYVAYAVL